MTKFFEWMKTVVVYPKTLFLELKEIWEGK
jgi:hypothetical protein